MEEVDGLKRRIKEMEEEIRGMEKAERRVKDSSWIEDMQLIETMLLDGLKSLLRGEERKLDQRPEICREIVEQELKQRLERANWWAREKRYEEAEECYKELLPLVEESLGPNDKNTLNFKFKYANTL